MKNYKAHQIRIISRAETEALKILKWRQQIEKMCRDCEEKLNAFNLQENTELSIKQAQAIVTWEMQFNRFKLIVAETRARRKNFPHSFTQSGLTGMDDIKHAIKHARKNLIEPHLYRAISTLQHHTKTDAKIDEQSVADSDSGTVIELTDNQDIDSSEKLSEKLDDTVSNSDGCEKLIPPKKPPTDSSEDSPGASEKFAAGLHDVEKQKEEKLEVTYQSLKTKFNQHREEKQDADPLFKEQKRIKRLRKRMNYLDIKVLRAAQADARTHYALIQKNHDAMEIWLSILKEAYAIALQRIDAFLEKVQASKDKREEIKESLLKGFVSLAMSPFLLNNLVDPAVQIFNSILEQIGGFAQNFTQTDSPVNIYSELQKQLLTFLSMVSKSEDSHETTIKKIHKMREKNPMEFMDLMQRFSAYKLHGIAEEMSQAFDPENNTIWDGHNPIDIIRAQRMKLLRKAQKEFNKEEWDEIEKNKYYDFFNDIHIDLDEMFSTLTTDMFSEIKKQYPPENDINLLQKIIKLFSFDESSSGLKAVKKEKRLTLVEKMADDIEKQMLLTFGAFYDPFFGGNIHITNKISQQVKAYQFDPYENSHFGLKPDIQGKAILDHLIEKMPEKKEILEPLKHVGYAEYMNEIWTLGTTPKQQERQKILNDMIQKYVNKDIVETLKETVFEFAAENHIKLPKEKKNITPNQWISETKLRAHAHKLTKPFIQEAAQYKSITHKQIILSKHIANMGNLLNHETVENVPQPGRLLKV